MRWFRRRMPARTLVLAFFFLAAPAMADTSPSVFERVGAFFDSVANGLRNVGERSEEIITPRVPASGGFDVIRLIDGQVISREVVERAFPLASHGGVHVENEFGNITVSAWDRPEVRARVEMFAGAADEDTAAENLRAISVHIDAQDDRVALRSALPGRAADAGVALHVNFEISVPRDASLVCENTFGDIDIQGLDGPVTVNARYGAVDLAELNGSVLVRAHGEFPMRARNLRNGGTFQLNRSQAVFNGVRGAVRVDNDMGSVTLRDLADTADIDVKSKSGPIHLHLDGGPEPDLLATVTYGEIKSALPIELADRGNLTIARLRNGNAARKIVLNASFDAIHIHREEGSTDAPAPQATARASDSGALQSVQDRRVPLDGAEEILVDAIAGDVEIMGADIDELEVEATQVLRMPSRARSAEAKEALTLRTEQEGGRLTVQTKALQDLSEFGVTGYEVNLVLRVPRTMSLKVFAENGNTAVSGMGGAVSIEQETGHVLATNVKGELSVVNGGGDVYIADCAGPLRVVATGGEVITRTIYGPQDLRTYGGQTIIDSPQSDLSVRHEGGDVRIIALDALGGDFNVQVDDGNVNMVRTPDTDATFLITVENGAAESAVPLTGTMNRDMWEFSGRQNSGEYTVVLKAKNGDVMID